MNNLKAILAQLQVAHTYISWKERIIAALWSALFFVIIAAVLVAPMINFLLVVLFHYALYMSILWIWVVISLMFTIRLYYQLLKQYSKHTIDIRFKSIYQLYTLYFIIFSMIGIIGYIITAQYIETFI